MKNKKAQIYESWKVRLAGVKFGMNHNLDLRSNPVVWRDFVFVTAFSPGRFYCINKKNKKIEWKFEFKGLCSRAPSIYRGRVFTGSSRNVLCLNPLNGKVIWEYFASHDDGEDIYGDFTFDEDRIIFGQRDGHLICLSVKSGKVIWNTKIDSQSQVNCQPLIHGSRLVVCTTQKRSIVSLDRKSGKLIWKKNSELGSIYLPLLDRNGYLVHNGNSIARVEKNGVIREVFYKTDYLCDATLHQNGDLFLIEGIKTGFGNDTSYAKFLTVFENEKFKGRHYLGDYIFHIVITPFKNIICVIGFHDIFFFSTEKNEEVFRLKLNRNAGFWPARPAFDGDKMYLASHSGYVSCFQVPKNLEFNSRK